MNITLADLLPLVVESKIIVSTEEHYLWFDYTLLEWAYDCEESREADKQLTKEKLAPYMDRKVKSINGTSDNGIDIVVYGGKVDEDGY